MLTSERCDECISVVKIAEEGDRTAIFWEGSYFTTGSIPAPDEAELFAYRLLDAVKRARGE